MSAIYFVKAMLSFPIVMMAETMKIRLSLYETDFPFHIHLPMEVNRLTTVVTLL